MANVWHVKNIPGKCDGNMYLPILHLLRVELHCKLHEKLHHVTGPLQSASNSFKIIKKKKLKEKITWMGDILVRWISLWVVRLILGSLT